MSTEDALTFRIVPWEEEWGILIDYGGGSWRRYLVGTHKEAAKELHRLVFEKRWRELDNLHEHAVWLRF